jgi:glycosyltransferase involved in cell wall biosynthesis
MVDSDKEIRMKVCVVMPTRNEEKTIEKAVLQIRAAFADTPYREPTILVVDDSTDRTRELARASGCTVVNGGGKGLGYAMFKGLKASLAHDPDYIVSFDADGQADASEILSFLSPLEADEADMVIGSRFKSPDLINYHYRFKNRLGVRILVRILRALTGLPLTDSHGGIRAMRSDVIRELEMLGTHTYVQETIIDAVEKGFRIKEIQSAWKKREHGKSRVVSSIPTYVFFTLPILIIRSRQHIKWLYSMGILLVFAALAYFAFISYQASFQFKDMFSRLPSFLLIALLVLTGLQLFFFGFLIELIKEIKYRIDRLERWKDKKGY